MELLGRQHNNKNSEHKSSENVPYGYRFRDLDLWIAKNIIDVSEARPECHSKGIW